VPCTVPLTGYLSPTTFSDYGADKYFSLITLKHNGYYTYHQLFLTAHIRAPHYLRNKERLCPKADLNYLFSWRRLS